MERTVLGKITGHMIATAIALVITGHTAPSMAAGFQADTTVLNDDSVYDVNADGTYTLDETVSVRIETEQGIEQRSQVPLYFNPSLENLDVLDAYTTTPDGKQIHLGENDILLQESPESARAPTFSDEKVKTLVFPGVEVGATLTRHTRLTQKTPLFPGQFSSRDNFLDDKAFKSASITVQAPAALKLYVDAVDMQGGIVHSDISGQQKWRWTIRDTSAHAPENDAPPSSDYSPRVVISTFPSFNAVGSAYLERAAPQAAVTPPIQALADQITAGLTDQRMQADALYRWVSSNIRYVAIFIGFGSIVPHSAQAILDARYGDCKDHVTLLQALLAAKGIASSPVLVDTGWGYWLPSAAAPLAVFDHVITYLPEFKLYVDSTAGMATFGTLPLNERGKPALIADDGTGHAALVSLPLSNPETDNVSILTRITLDSNGNVKGNSEVKDSGFFDWFSRSIFKSLPSETNSTFATRVLTITGQIGTGSFRHSAVSDLTQPFEYSTQFNLPQYAQLSGPGGIRIPRGTAGLSDLAGIFNVFELTTRRDPLVFPGRRITENIELDLPDGLNVKLLPPPVTITSPFGTYTSTYSQQGQVITATRCLEITMQSPVVEPADYPKLRSMILAVKRDLEHRIVY